MASKKSINKFKINDIVKAQVIEILSRASLIVEFQGDLLRVENKTGHLFFEGDIIELRVSAVSPLAFALPVKQRMQYSRSV